MQHKVALALSKESFSSFNFDDLNCSLNSQPYYCSSEACLIEPHVPYVPQECGRCTIRCVEKRDHCLFIRVFAPLFPGKPEPTGDQSKCRCCYTSLSLLIVPGRRGRWSYQTFRPCVDYGENFSRLKRPDCENASGILSRPAVVSLCTIPAHIPLYRVESFSEIFSWKRDPA